VLLNYLDSPRNEEVTSATFVYVNINNMKYKTIVDSGAESTLISHRVAKQLNLKIINDDSLINYVTANGEKLNNLGWTIVEVKIGSYRLKQRCVVIKNLSANVLLGTDTLVNHGIVLNFRLKTLSVGKISIKMSAKGEQSQCCLAMSRRVELNLFKLMLNGFPYLKVLIDRCYYRENS